MSGLLSKRAWLGGVTLVALVGVAACGDDDDATMTGGGTDGGGKAGSAGANQAGKGGTPTSGGTDAGGKGGNAMAGKGGNAGTGGTSTAGTSMGGEPMTLGGEGGVSGSEGGTGGEGGAVVDPVRVQLVGTSPLPAVPADPTNAYADVTAAATLGQRLFFDEQFSGALAIDSDLGTTGDLHKVSCKSCHSGSALDDERSTPDNISKGTGLHSRNSPALVNSSFYKWTNWGGRFAAQWELPLAVVENGVIMNGTRLGVAHRIFDAYKADYEAVFGYTLPAEIGTTPARFPAAGKPNTATPGAWETMTTDDQDVVNKILVNYSKALAAYTRKLVSREAPFDAFMAGDDAAISASAKNGAKVFVDKGCMECHSGPHFSDDEFHDLGVPQTGPGVLASDDGRFKDTPGLVNSPFNINSKWSDKTDTGKLAEIPLPLPLPDSWKGLFRTPSLRGVAQSAPYMHSGQLATLSDVIDFYAAGGTADTAASTLTPFTITPQEKADLIAFLETLTGKPVPDALLTDTAAN
jgi:cytochrome c peroxidase